MTDEYHGTRFFLRRAGRTVATPLFAVLVAVETTDVLAGMMDRFVYLKFGLAAILVFVGIKMLIADVWHVPIALSLSVIAWCWRCPSCARCGRPPSVRRLSCELSR